MAGLAGDATEPGPRGRMAGEVEAPSPATCVYAWSELSAIA